MPDSLRILLYNADSSRAIWSELAKAVPILLAALLGGAVSYLATRSVEREKAKQQRADRKRELEATALVKVLEWLDPLELAAIHIWGAAQGWLFNGETAEKVREDWPYLGPKLIEDLPVNLRAHLPTDINVTVFKLIDEMSHYRSELLQIDPTWVRDERLKQRFWDTQAKANDFQMRIGAIRRDLVSKYLATFD